MADDPNGWPPGISHRLVIPVQVMTDTHYEYRRMSIARFRDIDSILRRRYRRQQRRLRASESAMHADYHRRRK